ncbi:MAG: polyprenyl synthetase family protein, partial [Cyclobacteriaceae bacterium]
PITYILANGGKRLRPLLALLTYQAYQPDPEKIIKAALALEVFHNFTLMHDDIMDNAPLRRGQETVHKKWNDNVAILSGDVMFVKAYDLLLSVDAALLPRVIARFNQCATGVCEGQQIDMNFEQEENVSESDYIDMIRKKTAVLIGFSLELGAILAGAPEADQKRWRNFGEKIGIGFQLKDDWLDVYADSSKFGKLVGGDIAANKKTYLLIKALEMAQGEDKTSLLDWLNRKQFTVEEKVLAVMEIYDRLNIKSLAAKKMNLFFNSAFADLEQLSVKNEAVELLKEFSHNLINREK